MNGKKCIPTYIHTYIRTYINLHAYTDVQHDDSHNNNNNNNSGGGGTKQLKDSSSSSGIRENGGSNIHNITVDTGENSSSSYTGE